MAAAATRTAKKKPSAALRRYAEKRDFAATPEPKPTPTSARSATMPLRFAVQKHDARRLHFDLRLELGGTLKSWAVAKGPSMTAGVRRLAVETEDHPIGYLGWEGVIPKGQYGGGTMIVWDRGTWAPEGDAADGLKSGKLAFVLDGERLKGKFSLVRMAAKPGEKRRNWLLIKSRDRHALTAGAKEPVETRLTSVKSGQQGSDLAARQTIRPDHRARARTTIPGVLSTASLARIEGARKAILPVFVEPSLALAVPAPPDGPDWLHELKHDGYRMQARAEGGTVRLLTRNGLDWTNRFPTVARSLEGLPAGALLIDGEIVVQDATGQSSFSGLQRDLKAGRHDRMIYYAFDLLHCNGVDLRGAALAERKRTLQDLLAASTASGALRYSAHLDTGGQPILTEACRLGLEGIVSKRVDLPYVSGRGGHWQKSKCALRQEFAIVGYVPSTVKGKGLGSVVLAYYDRGKPMHVGRAGTGFDDDESRRLAKRLATVETEMPSFGNIVTAASRRGVVWTHPQLVAEIEYRGWSADGLLRQAAFKGLREDKPAQDIGLDALPRAIQSPAPARPSHAFRLTHPERVLWTDPDVTKRDLADFYAAIADRILPEVTGRVLSLLRCPDGASSGQCFFAKHAWMGLGSAVRLVDTGSDKPMLAIDNLEGLLTLVQMNVLEIHAWGSRTGDIEHPDRITFDLDPGDKVAPAQLIAAAKEVRERLERLHLLSFLKSTGGKGLHIAVPLQPKAGWDEVKAFCKAFADVMAEDSPRLYTSTMSKARRTGRVFIDYLRNGRGATAISAYSTRARPHAPVAMPLSWDDIDRSIPSFDIRSAASRLAGGRSDPWKEMGNVRQGLPDLARR